MTFKEKLHESPASSDAPARLMLFDPSVKVMVPPPHAPLKPSGVETTKPAGNVSLNAIPVNPLAFGLVRLKLRLVLPFNGIWLAPNAVVIVGGEEVCASPTTAPKTVVSTIGKKRWLICPGLPKHTLASP